MSASLSQTAGPTTVERKCPTCRARNGGSEFAASKPRAESLDDETLAEHWRGFRSDKIFFTYLRCATCEQVYSPTYFSDEAVDELYHSMGDNTAGEDPATLTKTQGGYVDILAKAATPRGRWLDIGADIGLLAGNLRKIATVTAVDGLEPNVEVHAELASVIGADAEIFTNLADVNRTYDGIAAIHVVDHLLHPLEDLARWNALLNDDGLVLIVVHNEGSLLRRALGRKWPPYCLQHPQLYSPKSMKSFLDRSGFDVLAVRRTANYFSIDQFLAVGLAVTGIKYKRRDRLRSLVLPVRLGNIAIVARKRAGVVGVR